MRGLDGGCGARHCSKGEGFEVGVISLLRTFFRRDGRPRLLVTVEGTFLLRWTFFLGLLVVGMVLVRVDHSSMVMTSVSVACGWLFNSTKWLGLKSGAFLGSLLGGLTTSL